MTLSSLRRWALYSKRRIQATAEDKCEDDMMLRTQVAPESNYILGRQTLAQLLLPWSVWRCIWPIHFLSRTDCNHHIDPTHQIVQLIHTPLRTPSHTDKATFLHRMVNSVTSDLKTKVLSLKPLGKANVVMESCLAISAFLPPQITHSDFKHSGTAVVGGIGKRGLECSQKSLVLHSADVKGTVGDLARSPLRVWAPTWHTFTSGWRVDGTWIWIWKTRRPKHSWTWQFGNNNSGTVSNPHI